MAAAVLYWLVLVYHNQLEQTNQVVGTEMKKSKVEKKNQIRNLKISKMKLV
jgi:hypothetical protein